MFCGETSKREFISKKLMAEMMLKGKQIKEGSNK